MTLTVFPLAEIDSIAETPIDHTSVETPWFDWQGWLDSIGAWTEPTTTVVLVLALIVCCVIAWSTNLIALPGNWIAVGILAMYAWLGPQESRVAIGYVVVSLTFALALAGEIIEFLAGAMGAKKAGASRKSTAYAMIGSIGGAILGALIGLPVPLIGPVLAAVLFGGAGAAGGAIYGEWTDGRPWKESWNIGHAAFWGRTFGVLGKVTAGLAILVVMIIALLV